MKKLVWWLMAILTLQLEIKTVATPAWLLWGDPRNITFDPIRRVYVNTNTSIEGWRRNTPDPALRRKLLAPEEVPTKAVLAIALRRDLYWKKEIAYATAGIGVVASRKRFVLVNCEQNTRYDEQYCVYPHLGILTVGTAAEKEGYEVVLWDELLQGHVPLDQIVQSGDIVGLSIVVGNEARAVELARAAKALRVRAVIAGNDVAIFRANQFLALPDKPIDAVFTSNSLESVRLFFRQIGDRNLADLIVPNMQIAPTAFTYSNEREVLLIQMEERKRLKSLGLYDSNDVFVVPRLGLFSQSYWGQVWTNYRHQYGHKHANPQAVKNALALLAQGCTRTRGSDVCEYCTINGVGDIRFPSREYLEETVRAYRQFGIDSVFNVTDSSFEMTPILDTLEQTGFKMNGLVMYARAQGIARSPHLIDRWRSLTTDRLMFNVGMDSGDQQMLQSGINKSSTGQISLADTHRQAVRNIRERDAHLHYSLIFGAPGETRESCERSLAFLEWTIDTLGDQLDVVETDYFWLNFGSPMSRIFRKYEHAQEVAVRAGKTITPQEWHIHFRSHADELVVPRSAQEAYYKFFTHIERDTARTYIDRAAELMRRHTGSIPGRAFQPS